MYLAVSVPNNICVINTSTNAVTTKVPVVGSPGSVAFSPSIGNVSIPPVANFTCNVTKGYTPLTIQFKDLSTNATGWNWNFGDGVNSTHQSPSHTYSAAGDYTVNLTVSNPKGTDSKLARIKVISVGTWAKYAYISNSGSNTVSVIDVASDTVVATVPVGDRPSGVAITPDGTRVYVVNSADDTNTPGNGSVIDTSTNNVTTTVPAPGGVAVTPDGTQLYVTSLSSLENYLSEVSVINTSTNTIAARVPVTKVPLATFLAGVAVSPDGTKVYVTDVMNSSVSVIDTFTNNVTATVSVGLGSPLDVAFIPKKIADFTSNVTKGYAPLSVNFTDFSHNAIGWNWNFGDGANSTQQNPMHTYSTPGQYTVNLTVRSLNGTDSKSVIITVIPWGPMINAYITNSDNNSVSVIDKP